eukprot:gene56343-15864_t
MTEEVDSLQEVQLARVEASREKDERIRLLEADRAPA